MTLNICLLVFNYRGHFTHFAHLEWQALRQCGDVTIVGPKASLDSEEFSSSFQDEDIHKEYFEGTEAQAICQYVRDGKYQLLFSNGIDSYWHKLLPKLLWWKLTGQLKACISGILLSVPFVYPENSNASHKALRKFLLKHFAPFVYHRIYIIDEIAYGLLLGNPERRCTDSTFCLLEDPVENPSQTSLANLRSKLGWSQDERVLLAIGVIIQEKRIDLLIRAFLATKPTTTQRLRIAGHFAEGLYAEYSEILNTSIYEQQVMLEDRWLSDEEVTDYISASDFISVTYPAHFANASILFRAQKAGKLALMSNSGWIGRYGAVHSCGVSIDTSKTEEYMQGIMGLFSDVHSKLESLSPTEHCEEGFMRMIVEMERQA